MGEAVINNTIPDPLVSADVDLRGFEFMPLFGDRLFKSETWISASADAKVAALRLWWHSYGHEVPAGSLPDNDGLLAEYAGYGVMVKAWKKLKPQAMRGYILCSDGRWYHPLVAELAIDGWKERVRNREKQRAWRERNQQKDRNVTVTDTVTKPGTEPLCHAGQGQGQGQVNLNPNSSSLRSEELPPLAGRKKTFSAWLAEAKANGEKAISDYRPVWEYAEKVGLSADWIEIAWIKFRERYESDPNHRGKRYIDWRRVFLTAVDKNWFDLWFAKDGKFGLTTVGQQADIATRAAA